MKAFFFWENGRGLSIRGRSNPYAGLLARALQKHQIHLDEGMYKFDREWLDRGREDHDVLHLHWLHGFYRTEDLQSTIKKCNRFFDNLTYARSDLGYRIVWTLHNFYPHERPFPEVDHIARLYVSQQADSVITHCNYAAEVCRKHFFFKGNVNIIPHGNFIDVFPNNVSKNQAREKLGIAPEVFVYLFFGNARTYKGIDVLIKAFRKMDPDNAILLLMMRSSFNTDYADELRNLAGNDPRVNVHTSDFFPENEFQFFLNSADVVVIPFSEVLTSGSTIAALGFGKPVILPARGCLPELIDETMGILFDPDTNNSLPTAMQEIRTRDIKAAGRAARACAESLNWENIANRHAAIYKGQSAS